LEASGVSKRKKSRSGLQIRLTIRMLIIIKRRSEANGQRREEARNCKTKGEAV
jgi:hypothetical protein